MINLTAKEGKTLAIIAHFWVFGTLISWFLNLKDQNSFTNFYVRQMIGWHLLVFLNGWLIYNFLGGFIKWVLGVILVFFWFMSLLGALSSRERLTPVFGTYFQDWFKSL